MEMQESETIEIETVEPSEGPLQRCLTFFAKLIFILTFPVSIWFAVKVVTEYQSGVLYKFGKRSPGPAKPPGVYFVLPCIEELKIIDTRSRLFGVQPHEVQTEGGVTVIVSAYVYYRTFDAELAVSKVQDAKESTKLIAKLSIRTALRTRKIGQILARKTELAGEIMRAMNTSTIEWGIKIERVELRGVRLTKRMQASMNKIAETKRKAKASVITAEGEATVSKKLKEAADIMGSNPDAIKIRCLQTLKTIGDKNNDTVIIPFEEHTLRNLLQRLFGP